MNLSLARTVVLSLFLLLADRGAAWAAPSYRLTPGDVLSFSVLQFPELSREVSVGLDGTVFLPLLGALEAEGLTLDELRRAVGERIGQSPIRLTDPQGGDVWRGFQPHEVVIDISEHRPVYVTGAVEVSGEVAFRPGLTARQVIARAGGVGPPSAFDELRLLELGARRDSHADEIAAREERVERLRADLRALSGADGDGGADGTGAEAERPPSSAREEDDWLAGREDLRRVEREGRSEALEDMRERLDVLRRLQGVEEDTVRVQEAELARVAQLRERGIATEDVLSRARQDLLQASSRSLDTANELLRLRAAITEAENETEVVELSERIDLLDQIDAEAEGLARLRGAHAALDAGLRLADPGAGMSDGDLQILIHRTDAADGPVVAEPDEVLMPGDVVEVIVLEAPPADLEAGLR